MFNVALTPEQPPPPAARPARHRPTALIFGGGFVGTVLAGGLFALPLLFIDRAYGGPLDDDLLELEMLPMLALAGVVAAALAGVIAFLFLSAAHLFCRLGAPWLVATVAGGWSGLIAASSLTASDGALAFDEGLTIQLSAMLMCMAGSGLLARPTEVAAAEAIGRRRIPRRPQVALRQLFALTTCTAVVAATIASVPLTPHAKDGVLICLGIQGVIVAGLVGINRAVGFRKGNPEVTAAASPVETPTFHVKQPPRPTQTDRFT